MNRPSIPIGWRQLSPNEVINKGDKFIMFSGRPWSYCQLSIGWTIANYFCSYTDSIVIRKVIKKVKGPKMEIPAGYRIRRASETMAPGDYAKNRLSGGSLNLQEWFKCTTSYEKRDTIPATRSPYKVFEYIGPDKQFVVITPIPVKKDEAASLKVGDTVNVVFNDVKINNGRIENIFNDSCVVSHGNQSFHIIGHNWSTTRTVWPLLYVKKA
jgi:hypothetical protein